MAKARMGYEGKFYQGAAGAEATNEITNCVDQSYDFDYDSGDTTERGVGTVAPIETKSVTARKMAATWVMHNRDGDTNLIALMAAAALGTPIAFRSKDKVAGKGYDGDVILKVKHGRPIRGEQTYEFSAEPNDDFRTPQLYV